MEDKRTSFGPAQPLNLDSVDAQTGVKKYVVDGFFEDQDESDSDLELDLTTAHDLGSTGERSSALLLTKWSYETIQAVAQGN